MRRVFLRLCFASTVVVVQLVSTISFAETISKQQCLDAHVQSQEAKLNKKLRIARKHLEVCSNPICPLLVRKDCTPWLTEVQGQIAKLQLQVSASGLSAQEIRATLDGESIPVREVIEIDPGEHSLQVQAPGFVHHAAKVKVEPGQRYELDVVLQPDSTAKRSGKAHAAPLIFGGIGVVGLGAFTYFGLKGWSGEDELKRCKPLCDPVRVDEVSRTYILADVGLGVGVITLGAAAYLWLRKPTEPAVSVVPWVSRSASGVGIFRVF